MKRERVGKSREAGGRQGGPSLWGWEYPLVYCEHPHLSGGIVRYLVVERGRARGFLSF
jgi:hypothetical protein